MRRYVLFPLFLVCALGLAACGGSGGLTQQQFAAKLSRMCLIAADGFRELHLDDSVGAWSNAATDILAIDRTFETKLATLEPPSSIADAVAAYTRVAARRAQDDRNAVAAAKAGSAAKLHSALTRGGNDDAATYPSARAIGATGCYPG